MSSPERRAHARFDIRLGAEIRTADRSFSAETKDVSAGGACVKGPYPLEEQSFVEIALHLVVDGVEDADMPPLEARAQVQWTVEGERSEGWRYMAGLRFDGIGDEHRQWIEQVIARSGKSDQA